MKVKDLINAISNLDPEMDVICYSEDEKLFSGQHQFRILEIEGVDITEAEKRRGKDGIPTLKLGRSEYSKKLVTLSVTTEFKHNLKYNFVSKLTWFYHRGTIMVLLILTYKINDTKEAVMKVILWDNQSMEKRPMTCMNCRIC